MSEKELAEQCKKRNSSAEREVFAQHSAMLRGICCRYARDVDEAEDMLQDGLIRIFDTVGSFSWQGEGSFVAWMRRVVVNNAINHYKKTKRMKLWYVDSDCEFEDRPDQSEEASDEDPFGFNAIRAAGITQQILFDILQRLPEMYRVVFNLSVIDGLRHKEIASMLGIDESSSRSRLLRAKNMLRDSLKEYMRSSTSSNQTDKTFILQKT